MDFGRTFKINQDIQRVDCYQVLNTTGGIPERLNPRDSPIEEVEG